MSRTAGDDPLDVVAGTAEAAFATDASGRIVIWNKAAERLLGYEAAGVLGRPCQDLICGRDIFGNAYCGENCTVMRMAARREPIHQFEMDIRSASGKTVQASFTIVVVPGSKPDSFNVVHILRPTGRDAAADEFLRRILRSSPAPGTPYLPEAAAKPAAAQVTLTAREIEVLRLMAEGAGTQNIADTLFISRATARNHIQHILDKLGVHSKMEAVSLAFRNSLI